nr:cytochrome b5-like heme/steroid binding domain-containing protein [Tanacetum cinerariifolium]
WEAKFEEKYVKVFQLGFEKASTAVVDEKLQEDQTKEE